jgi:hypothetical protein
MGKNTGARPSKPAAVKTAGVFSRQNGPGSTATSRPTPRAATGPAGNQLPKLHDK